jgi:hypothetical protein
MAGYLPVNLVEHIRKAIDSFACAKLKESGVTCHANHTQVILREWTENRFGHRCRRWRKMKLDEMFNMILLQKSLLSMEELYTNPVTVPNPAPLSDASFISHRRHETVSTGDP